MTKFSVYSCPIRARGRGISYLAMQKQQLDRGITSMALTWGRHFRPSIKPRRMRETLQKTVPTRSGNNGQYTEPIRRKPILGLPNDWMRGRLTSGARYSLDCMETCRGRRKRPAQLRGEISNAGNRSDLNGKVNDYIIPAIADVVYKSSPTFVRLRTSNAQRFDGGPKIRQNIGYAEL